MGVILRKLFMGKKKSELYRLQQEKDKIVEYLNELQKLESKLWGISVRTLKSGEEEILDNANHLIYMYSRGHHDRLSKILSGRDVKAFLKDLDAIKKDFLVLKKELRDKERLKLLISNFTIKLIDAKNYNKFKDVFLLEKKLYEVLDRQDVEFDVLLKDVSKLRVAQGTTSFDVFMASLKKLGEILSGHLDNIKYFEEDRSGYSNTSNLIHELILIFEQKLD